MSNRADATAITDEGTTRADLVHNRNYVWDPIGLAWVRETQPGGGSGGGGAVTVADGADVAQGTTTDASSANTIVGILKAIKAAVQGTLTVGTHAVTQSGGPWTENTTQLAGTAIDVNSGIKGAGTQRVVIATDQVQLTNALKVDGSAVTQPVSGTFFQGTQPVSLAATVNVNPTGETAGVGIGAAADLSSSNSVIGRLKALIALLPTALGQSTMANSLRVVIASDQTAVPASQSGTWTVQPGNTANTTAWKVDGSAVTQPVSGTVTANEGTKRAVSTSVLANVAASVTVVTLQALNTNRLMWMFYNDSSSACYVKFGATASATSFTVKVPGNGYYELPATNVYTGIITALWDVATGNARVTELTA